MEQQRALNALEPFIALSKTATSPRAAADLVVQATSASNTYVFAELLETPNIQNLRNSPEHASYLKLLEIFAWGTVANYAATPNLPELNQAQSDKLKLLSLLPLCKSRESLTYDTLQEQLELPDAPALEKVITSAIYAGLIQGNLDPLNKVVRVSAVAPLRDLPPNSVKDLLATLGAWDKACVDALEDINARTADIRKKAVLRKTNELRKERAYEEAMKDGEKGGKRTAPMGGSDSLSDLMDVDEGIAEGRTSGRVAKRIGRGLGLK